MKRVTILEYLPSELAGLSDSNRLAELRQDGISIVWTPLLEFNAFVLNIFAPTSFVFWNFCLYRSLLAAERRFHSQFLTENARGNTHSKIASLAKKAGAKKKSDFVHDMLGAWTKSPEFNSTDEPTALRRLEFRHTSLLVPGAKRDSVQNYIDEQLKCWNEDALYAYPETSAIWHFDEIDRDSAHWKLLYWPVLKTTADDREWLYYQAAQFGSDQKLKELAANLDPRFAIKGVINFACIPKQFLPFVDLKKYAIVLHMRARLAVMICPLPQIEKFFFSLNGTDRIGDYPVGILEEMRELFSRRLEPYGRILDFTY